jgi:hypothetical protein
MSNVTGESTASIYARADANAWPKVYVALTKGAHLFRPSGMDRYFTKCSDDRDPDDGIGISAKFVKFQAEHGCLRRIGVDMYGLDDERKETSIPAAVQMELFQPCN